MEFVIYPFSFAEFLNLYCTNVPETILNYRDNYPKYAVSPDEFDMSRNGIKHRNIRDFLLADEWN